MAKNKTDKQILSDSVAKDPIEEIQADILNLVERRLISCLKLKGIKEDIDSLKEEVKIYQADFNVIDDLLKEKMNKMRELRNPPKMTEAQIELEEVEAEG